MPRKLIALFFVFVLVAASCGDSDDETSSDPETDTETSAAETSDGDTEEAGGNPEDTEPDEAAAISDTPLVIARDMDLSTLDPSRSFCDTCHGPGGIGGELYLK